MSEMSRSERLELAKVVRLRARVTRHDLEAQAARHLAHVEKQLAATYSENHERWREITAAANDLVRKADAEIANRCREMGIPESFRPSLSLSWYRRGENADRERRSELRRVAESELEARVQAAKVQVDRSEVELLTRLAADGLTSDAAMQFLESLPTVDQLMPQLALSELEKRVALPVAELDLDE